MKCVIVGAGKIARGFIGHLLYLSEIRRETDNICIELAKEYLDKHNVKYKDKDIVKQDKKKK